MISVIIPMCGKNEFTTDCVNSLYDTVNFYANIEVLVIDNNSPIPYKPIRHEAVYRYDENQFVLDGYKSGLTFIRSDTDIVMFLHNDTLFWEVNWNTRIEDAFKADERLGMMGLFGGRGVSRDGGRGYPESNMQGRKIGTHGNQHGYTLTGMHPAVIFDSYCMIFRKKALEQVGIDQRIPPHFWYDRILPLDFIKAGWNCATIGIAHDHAGGTTSCAIPMDNWIEIYKKGEALFLEKHGDILNLFVNKEYRYICGDRILFEHEYREPLW